MISIGKPFKFLQKLFFIPTMIKKLAQDGKNLAQQTFEFSFKIWKIEKVKIEVVLSEEIGNR